MIGLMRTLGLAHGMQSFPPLFCRSYRIEVFWADEGYDADAACDHSIRFSGGEIGQVDRRNRHHDRTKYRWRNLNLRRIATRFDRIRQFYLPSSRSPQSKEEQ